MPPQAAEFLQRLSGREHEVLTAIAFKFGERMEAELSATAVRFRELGRSEIERYVASGEPMDKAGAYGIQGRAGAFVAEIRGSYSGVMGLPLYETTLLLRAGIGPPAEASSRRAAGRVADANRGRARRAPSGRLTMCRMTEDILINVTPQETRVAVMHSGVAQELHIERSASRGLVGNIYMGKVARVLPGDAVGLRRDRPGARRLPARGRHLGGAPERPRRRRAGQGGAQPIEKILAEGQPLLVQVVKDPIGTKGARLSTQISIAGRMLVHLPQDAHIGISQRIEDESGARAAARAACSRCCPPTKKAATSSAPWRRPPPTTSC